MSRITGPTQDEIENYRKLFLSRDYIGLEREACRLSLLHPNSGEVWKALGVALMCQGKEALPALKKAVELSPNDAATHINLGCALADKGNLDEAIECYQRALNISPDDAKARYNLANAQRQLGRFEVAIANYRKALESEPSSTDALVNLGLCLSDSGQFDDALACYRKALEINPNVVEAYINMGIAYRCLRHLEVAIDCYRKALQIYPHSAEANLNLGNAQKDQGQPDNAIESYQKAIELNPGFAEAYACLGETLLALNKPEQALQCFCQARIRNPKYKFLYGRWLHTKMKICEWDHFNDHLTQLFEKVERGEKSASPFVLISLSNDPTLQKRAAEIYAREGRPENLFLPAIQRRNKAEKIHIGYFSADFHNHATAYLIADLLERHDKSKFKLTGFSFGASWDDEMRKRIRKAFDNFLDVRALSDLDIAKHAREIQIDIAIDLKGFTQDSRPGIFSLRAAPLQVSYLGYPGTMGAGYIDYLIADPTLIPKENAQDYSEKIIYLPDSYQANDRKRKISAKQFSREELGLPARSFVFCCFNNNQKILPKTFDSWMHILSQVENSVLWLFKGCEKAADNLWNEAWSRGIDPTRLIFAESVPLAEHLARHRQADLFLDTFPCNAHTTASDALWAGLPVLTWLGKTFAGRVAGSLLKAIRLPELIAKTQEEYEALAIELATNPEKLAYIKQKLAANRLTTPLFDTELLARHMESAYSAIYDRHQDGLPPQTIYVRP